MGRQRKLIPLDEKYAGECTECGGKMHTIDSRKLKEYTRRRLECGGCERRISTIEIPKEIYDALKSDQHKLRTIKAALL